MEETNEYNDVTVPKTRSPWRFMIAFVLMLALAVTGYCFRGPAVELLSHVVQEGSEEVKVAYADSFSSLDPANFEAKNRNLLGNVYEGLTRFDKNLDLESALAVSWGQIDDLTWEFKLRENVYFHDGSMLDPEDVVSSFEYALESSSSQVVSLISSVESIEVSGDSKVKVVTTEEDPILPNRLAHVYVFPSEIEDPSGTLIGTGPYYFESYGFTEDERVLLQYELNSFPYYWGGEAYYDDLNLLIIPDKGDRVNMLIGGEIDVLANVASEHVDELEYMGLDVYVQPSLEVNFFLFNTLEGSVFSDLNLRKAFSYAVNREYLISDLGEYAEVSNQFVAYGVNGYDSSLPVSLYDAKAASVMFEEAGVDRIEVHMVKGMEALGDFVEESFYFLENVDLDYHGLEAFQNGVLNQQYDVYFLGYKSDVGDAADLYETLFVSDGAYNGGYDNPEVDRLVERASSEDDQSARLKILKEVMNILVEEDMAGVPLFESELIYGFSPDISWSPRIDGFVFGVELR